MSRKKRRADGSLRPAVMRSRLKRRGQTVIDPRDQEKFASLTVPKSRIWNSLWMREQLSLEPDGFALVLEASATRNRWMKLRDGSGAVRCIGVPHEHPLLEEFTGRELRSAMLAELGLCEETQETSA